jgi:PAS domain-containing protein
VTSSTSSSESTATTNRRSWILLAAAALILVVAEIVVGLVRTEAQRPVDELLAPPVEDGVWLVGNSMMETGVDRERVRAELGVDVRIEDHGAHYSSLWCVIIRNALLQAEERPAAVVWGYRPRTAAIPPLRVGADDDADLFLDGDDDLYASLVGASAPGDWFGAELADVGADIVAEAALWESREDAQSWLDEQALRVAVEVLRAGGAGGTANLLERDVLDGDRSLADIAVWLTTDGRVEYANEQVDDLAGGWVKGEPQVFLDTFLPHIAQLLIDAGIPQIVVVHPQRDASSGVSVPSEEAFVAEANEWFEARGIPVVDGYNDPLIIETGFGGGDHLAVEGRAVLTEQLITTLKELLDP